MSSATFATTTDMIQVGLFRIRVGAVGCVERPDGATGFRARDLIEISTGKAPKQGIMFTREQLAPHISVLEVETIWCD